MVHAPRLREGEGLQTPRTTTADFVHARLRKEAYTPDDLADRRRWIGDQLKQDRDVDAYLKHDKKGESPEHALRLLGS